MAESSSLDELFRDRYTENDERYRKMAETGFEKVIVVHPWDSRNNNYRNRGGFNDRGGRGGYQHRGGGNSNRGSWGGRGGQYGGNRGRGGGGWQDRGGQRQPWRGGDRRRQYND